MSRFLGVPILRKEDPALLSGAGRYADDLPVPAGTLHAHVIRSPHAHAKIVGIDATEALAQDGIWAVVTGEDVRALSDPFLIALKAPVHQWSLAVERVRYVGEPVAFVVADTRYLAEDAADLVRIDYEPLEAVVDPLAACDKSAPLLHAQAKTNEISVRKFSYGDAKRAFEQADARVALTCEYPRNSFTPMECYVVVAEYRPSEGSYDVLANFQGPFSTHPVMARALRVAGPKLRLRIPPDSGGSFGIKLSVFPYIVLAAIAARITGRPVKWVEDRLEHLLAASSGPNRITQIEAAVTKDGRILALRVDQPEDYGEFRVRPCPARSIACMARSPEPMTAPTVDVVNRVVLTNKMPASLIRGFGGPQLYLALERRCSESTSSSSIISTCSSAISSRRRSFRTRRPPARSTIWATTARGRRRPARDVSPTSSAGATPHARRDGATASDSRPWSSPACPTWATCRRCSRPRRATRPDPRTARCRWSRSTSSARRGLGDGRRHRAGAGA